MVVGRVCVCRRGWGLGSVCGGEGGVCVGEGGACMWGWGEGRGSPGLLRGARLLPAA